MATTTRTASRNAQLQAGINALLVLDLLDGLPGAGLNGELHDVAGDDLAAFAAHMRDSGDLARDAGNSDLASGCCEAADRCTSELARRRDPRA